MQILSKILSLAVLSCILGSVYAQQATIDTPPGTLRIPVFTTPDGRQRATGDMRLTPIPGVAGGTYEITTLAPIEDHTETNFDPDFNANLATALQSVLESVITNRPAIEDPSVTAPGRPGAILGVITANGNFRGVVGSARVDSTGRGLTPLGYSHRVRIGSNTKTMISQTVLTLIQQGRFTLDTSVATLLPELTDRIPNSRTMLVRHLLRHQHGLFNYVVTGELQSALRLDPGRVYTSMELLELGLAQPPAFAPGEGYSYSNTGYILLGMIIERVTEQPLHVAFQQVLAQPLRLTMTEISTTPMISGQVGHGYGDYCLSPYDPNDPTTVAPTTLPQCECRMVPFGEFCTNGIRDDLTYLDPSVSWAAGAMVSNIPDLARFARARAKGEIFVGGTESALYREMTSVVTYAEVLGVSVSMGLGMVVLAPEEQASNPALRTTWRGHFGQIEGYDSMAFHSNELDITMAFIQTGFRLGVPTDVFTLVLAILPTIEAFTLPTTRSDGPTLTSTEYQIFAETVRGAMGH